ncbi:glutaminase A [Aureibacillus halotolerans]|uniref:Glutaminase n=1 Tax=Aureibacillus halotolerans TaxID=1508390 RepID=A0A4R6U6Y8_9BACI|nr:glutaminase A [Aureibacillus halotolerans]TDQ42278.1 L-glutaminase [Aureibacillus halotolerans]
MYCQTSSELAEILERAVKMTTHGKVATYIPALAKASPSLLGISIYHDEEKCFHAGQTEQTFTLQSISKVIALALALMDHGAKTVFQHVGMEPTGDPFNSIAKLETMQNVKPLNPMINAGALVVSSLIKGATFHEKLGRLLDLVHDMTNVPERKYNHEVAKSEIETAHLNRSLAYFLKQHKLLSGHVEDLIEFYSHQCAIEVSCKDLARIGAVLAYDGKDPVTKRIILPAHIARICKTFMVTCGMYNASGEFAIRVGIPAKSGVSGAIVASIPGWGGIGIYGPALDDKGNSIGGMRALEIISHAYDLHIF